MIPTIVEEIARLHRMANYHIVRPSLANDVPSVRQWLRDHRDGGWQQGADADRMRTAARLLFTVWLVEHDRLNGAPDA